MNTNNVTFDPWNRCGRLAAVNYYQGTHKSLNTKIKIVSTLYSKYFCVVYADIFRMLLLCVRVLYI